MIEEKAKKNIIKISEDFESALFDIEKESADIKRAKNDDDLKKWL